MDFARRAHDHNFRLDPIIREQDDDDFYKFPMQRFVRHYYPGTVVRFSMTNRTKGVRLADIVSIEEMREQLDHARSLRFSNAAINNLTAQRFYGRDDFFPAEHIDWLRTFQLPDYELSVKDGQFVLESEGPWELVMLWEMKFLTITNELRMRALQRRLSRFELQELYARATVKLLNKLHQVKDAKLEGLNLTDFGTRRRFSHLWQEFCIEAAMEVLRDKFTGTSNVYFARKFGLEAKGTNAHELPMSVAALAAPNEEDGRSLSERLKSSQYDVLRKWEEMFPALTIMLPDTFGTTQFLRDAPEFLNSWIGARPDSKKPHPAAEELIDWWVSRGQRPQDKLIIFSDGIDSDQIVELHQRFSGIVRVGFGWGTNLTNDFRGCYVPNPTLFDPVSLVAKVKSVNGVPAVKLSDNYEKATGDPYWVNIYHQVFGTKGMANAPVRV